MPTVPPVLLPAAFGLLGTVVGGVLTMVGQLRADRRAQEKRSEEHYAAQATEMIAWLGSRSKGRAAALALSAEESRTKAQEIEDQYPLSDFVLRAQTYFPELEDHVGAFVQSELETTGLLNEAAKEAHPFELVDKSERRAAIERGVLAARPILDALAEARRQVTVHRPARLDMAKVVGAADQQARDLAGFLKRRG